MNTTSNFISFAVPTDLLILIKYMLFRQLKISKILNINKLR